MKIRSLVTRLACSLALTLAASASAEIIDYPAGSQEWCRYLDDAPPAMMPAAKEADGDADVLKRLPGVRAPRAEEVGEPTPRAAKKGAQTQTNIPPLPGLPLDTSFASAGWLPQGPAPVTAGSDIPALVPGDPANPSAGAVQAIAPHPTNENILYIGTVNGGVWRTDNALAKFPRWRPLTDDQMSLSIGCLAFDPNDPTGNTIVAGIGRRSSIAQLGGAQKGLLRSTNGGINWDSIGATALAGRQVLRVLVRGNTFLLAVPATDNGTAPGLYRTTDGGATFTNMSGAAGSGLPAGGITDLVGDPGDSTRFFVHVSNDGVYRSQNSGVTWAKRLDTAGSSDCIIAAGIGDTVTVATVEDTPVVNRSTNRGLNWTQIDSVKTGAAHLHHAIVADPTNANVVYLSGVSGSGAGKIFRGDASLPAGSQWTSLSERVSAGGTGPHTDSRGLAFTAGNRLIECDDGGVYELAIANVGSKGDGLNGGSKWRPLLGNLQNGEVHSVAYDTVGHSIFAGLQDNQAIKVSATLGIPVYDLFLGGDGGDAAGDALASPGQTLRYGCVQYLGNFINAFFDANNNQVSFSVPAKTLVGAGTPIVTGDAGNMPFYTTIATNPFVADRVVLGGKSVTYESTDRGSTVKQIDTAGANSLPKIAYGGRLNGVVAPDVLFYGAGNNDATASTICYRTTTGGAVNSIAFPGGPVQGVIFDPQNWKTAFVIGQTAVYIANDIATNGAGGFTDITGNLTGVGTFHTLEYLTLPDGNALMVGTDVGAYIMRVASPGVWKTLGNNLPHVPVFDSQFVAAEQVLVVGTLGRGAWLFDFKPTRVTGQYGETFQGYPEESSTLSANTGELFSTHLGTVAEVLYDALRELRLTADGTGSTRTAFRLPDLNPGHAVPAFSAKWNALISGDSSNLADGFSFNFGPLGSLTGADFTSTNFFQEQGYNAGLAVGVTTFSGNTPGYYVRINGAVVPSGFVSKPSANWGNFNSQRHFFEVDWRMDTGLTLRVDGVPIFTDLPTPGYIPKAGDRFVFGARTGGFDEELDLDNIAIVTGGVLVPVQATAPFYAKSDNPPNETAARAFDGSASTKWLSTDYITSIGASFSAAKTIRLYTLTSANDVTARAPVMWDFQTGDDGVLWARRGAQSAQSFLNFFESRAYVVANPAAASKFRLFIYDNAGDLNTQLAEFQAWELLPVAASLTVANTNATGAGSLRQAISDAAPFNGPTTIKFAPTLAGQTITLTGGPLQVSNPDGVVIDASSLNAGLTISGNNASQLVNVSVFGSCTLKSLTLTGGRGVKGGAIVNGGGRLSLQKCTLTGNTATDQGGAIYSDTNSDFTTSSTELIYCTIAGNSANEGGGIYNYNGRTTLIHCTVAGNTAPAGSGSGIASFGDIHTQTRVDDTIIAQNSSSDADFVVGTSNSFASTGFNLVSTGNALPGFNNVADQVNVLALLAPLDNYGGLSKTMALRLGSPARNAGADLSTETGDQRGFPIVGFPDIGAYEAGTYANYNAFIWEQLPANATLAQRDAAFDFDGDGVTNGDEFLAQTNPADSTSYLRLTQSGRSGANFTYTFPTVAGRHYTVEYSADLVAWTTFAAYTGTGSPVSDAVGPVTGFPKFFLRVRVGP